MSYNIDILTVFNHAHYKYVFILKVFFFIDSSLFKYMINMELCRMKINIIINYNWLICAYEILLDKNMK